MLRGPAGTGRGVSLETRGGVRRRSQLCISRLEVLTAPSSEAVTHMLSDMSHVSTEVTCPPRLSSSSRPLEPTWNTRRGSVTSPEQHTPERYHITRAAVTRRGDVISPEQHTPERYHITRAAVTRRDSVTSPDITRTAQARAISHHPSSTHRGSVTSPDITRTAHARAISHHLSSTHRGDGRPTPGQIRTVTA